jgi:hypothetical protein
MYSRPTKAVVEIPNNPDPKMSHTDSSTRSPNPLSKKFVKLSLHTDVLSKRSTQFKKKSKLLSLAVMVEVLVLAEVVDLVVSDSEEVVAEDVVSVVDMEDQVVVDMVGQAVDLEVMVDQAEENINYNEF